ncbi:hypothetical protein IGI92_000626 [Enterococcus sp. DIV2379]|uniref:bacterial Ig-like domain-containing protein n=1 Tax=Enterococcus sp. DIV2379 TaxID=2774684 RepID=UPI003D2FE34D
MKKRVVIIKSGLIGMLILGTTFPSTWPIAQATERQQIQEQTPPLHTIDSLLTEPAVDMNRGETAASQEARAADMVSSETNASQAESINLKEDRSQPYAAVNKEDAEIEASGVSKAETNLGNMENQVVSTEQAKSTENFTYDLTVEYDPIKYKALDLVLPIPEKYAQQTLYQYPQLGENFYVYKTNEIYILKGLGFTQQILGNNPLHISWTSFTGFIINYYGLTAILEYNDANGNLLFTATYNIRFTNSHLTIKYVDETGMKIYPSQTINDSTNEPYDVSTSAFIPQIPGYILDTSQLPTNAKGVLPRGEVTVTYVYQKAPTDYTDLTVKDTTIYEQDTWTAADNFEQAISKEGKTLTYEEFIAEGGRVSGQVDTNKAATYKISYQLNHVSKEATILVKPRFTAIKVHDSSIYVGDDWAAEDNFDQAVDRDNNPVSFADVNVEGSVDTKKPGSYEVVYRYDGVASKAVITVKADQTKVTAHDSELYTGDNWTAKDNFDNATDRDGSSVDFGDITVTGIVDTTKVGEYEVIYSYHDLESKALITVKADQTTVKVHDSELYTGGNWTGKDNFDSATDRDGKPVDFEDITVTGKADTTKAGEYEVTYIYRGVESKATITVKADETSLKVHDSTIKQGDEWLPETNFDSATDRDGKKVAFSEVEVNGTVNNNIVGQYTVSYHYGAVIAHAVITIQAKVSETPDETPTEVPEENRPESESPGTEIPETEASDPITEEPIKARPETETSETNDDEKNEKRPSEQSDNPSATGQTTPIKASKQSTVKKLPKTGETSSVLLSVTGILFLIGGLVLLYRKKSWRK